MSFPPEIILLLLSLIMSEQSPLMLHHQQPVRRFKYRFKLVKSLAAVLVLALDLLFHTYRHFSNSLIVKYFVASKMVYCICL